MKLMRIKWENIFGLILTIILTIMTINYVKNNDIGLDLLVGDIMIMVVFVVIYMWVVRLMRKSCLKD